MSKPAYIDGVSSPRKSISDKRCRPRQQVPLGVRIHPFDPRFRDIEDVALVANFSRDGLYFTTAMLHYFVGMRLEIGFPHGHRVPTKRKYLGLIVRIEDQGDGKSGVAVRFIF